ncbi:sialate:O-sulfotransferase 2 [Cottoperca gobio]|uniref:WSC domain-containing protein 2 n=1 Tax=Cottoperca gobio TaxID=56716 RepID=A0A6J2QDI1_COTGO|nr:WSC domain-containing protein 2 [Cottoperca gobio]XP_029296027.1 WSC domain-containing protein 2 [Cottoperca gobio]XP_029296028.1 WSC domain-containing protein 2 [Cottoperca gobio]XP_029296029.1 WSC domain-containing protein 2 [Cottoperca gobio]XP_029296030.1 WSC domain-containing protein 2 [Cottoperca gobio]XP_029296031.1 WSC domain-containing protein 2 [Cottoperca gobio]XP_029296032.1 WSC domain-containing protein 2 [Cottoperca gobio]XP_029296033.1 WSC domain-containing protein 2 [Cotto
MAKALLKIQRYFRRKPIRFFSLILLYLTAGSLVFLHSGFVGDSGPGARRGRDSVVAAEMGSRTSMSDTRGLGIMSRVFKETRRSGRRYGPPWMKKARQDQETVRRAGDYTNNWNRALKGRSAKDVDDGRAKYIGCYIDDTQKRALRGVSFFDYKKMTVFRCQDNCAERGYIYAGLEFGAECYCGHKIQAPNASDSECNMECKGEKSNLCGGATRLSIYRLELSQESARRYGSSIFKGCFHRPDNVTLALPFSAVIQNMSVDKCVDMCTEREKSLAVLAGDRCHCGFPTSLFSLHEPEDESMCLNHCHGEEFETCGTDEYFVVYQTQVQDNRCMDRHFLPTRAKHLVALASFPGAGNTWARHLIELATGFYTGSYYFDGSLYNKGFKGERDHWRSGRTICIKTHESGKKEIESFDSCVLMIRNPYKALMAEFNRKYGGHIGFASQAHWKGKEWPEFVKNYSPWWASHTLDWLNYGKTVHVVHFENVKRDLFSQLKGMVQFLDLKVSEDRLLCVEGQKDGNFKRSGLRKLEYDPYTPEMRANINELIRTVDVALRKRNMSSVPEEYMPR